MADNFEYPPPIQGGSEPVTRQRGLPPVPTASVDPLPFPEIVQGSPEIHTYRNPGLGQHFLADGTLVADHRAEDGTFFGDLPTIAVGEAIPPPAPAPVIATTDLPLPPRPAFVQADEPGAASADPRDAGSAPMVFSAEQLAAAKKAKKGKK